MQHLIVDVLLHDPTALASQSRVGERKLPPVFVTDGRNRLELCQHQREAALSHFHRMYTQHTTHRAPWVPLQLQTTAPFTVNFYRARRPRSNPTSTLTLALSPTFWWARGRRVGGGGRAAPPRVSVACSKTIPRAESACHGIPVFPSIGTEALPAAVTIIPLAKGLPAPPLRSIWRGKEEDIQ